MLFPFFSFCFGSLSNFVMTEWTPEGQADQPAGRQARLQNL